jgi:hypothetical protein
MSLTIPLIGLTTLAGYFFGKDEKNSRSEISIRKEVDKHEVPNGQNIYSSNVVEKANDQILQQSLQNYKLAEVASETGMIPPLFNTYSVVGNDSILSKKINGEISGLSSEQLGKLNDINRVSNVKGSVSREQTKIDEMPMFTSTEKFLGKGKPVLGEASFGKMNQDTEINILTGLPFEKAHANMVPFFGSTAKQNMEEFSNQSLLDIHTGNTSTFQHKAETGQFFKNQAENIYGNPVFATQIDTDRYIPSLYKQGERPVEQQRVPVIRAGTIQNNIRPSIKTVDELRAANKPKQTYEGRTIAGQMGEVRGIQPEVHKRRPDTYYEKTHDHLFRGPGEFTAITAKEDYSNIKHVSRESYNMEYFGNYSNPQLNKTKQRISPMDNSHELTDALFQEPKRHNFENDYLRNANGGIVNTQNTSDYGRASIKNYQSERETTGEVSHLLNAKNPNAGMKIKPRDDAKTTIKETTMYVDNFGNVKTVYNRGANSAYIAGISDFSAKETQKETLVNSTYEGQIHKPDGMAYVVNKYEAKITGKEMISANSDYTSNPRSFQTGTGSASYGDVKHTENMKLKELEDPRPKMNVNTSQIIPSKQNLGIAIKFRKDNGPEDTINRFQPDIISSQLVENPYHIKTAGLI